MHERALRHYSSGPEDSWGHCGLTASSWAGSTPAALARFRSSDSRSPLSSARRAAALPLPLNVAIEPAGASPASALSEASAVAKQPAWSPTVFSVPASLNCKLLRRSHRCAWCTREVAVCLCVSCGWSEQRDSEWQRGSEMQRRGRRQRGGGGGGGAAAPGHDCHHQQVGRRVPGGPLPQQPPRTPGPLPSAGPGSATIRRGSTVQARVLTMQSKQELTSFRCPKYHVNNRAAAAHQIGKGVRG